MKKQMVLLICAIIASQNLYGSVDSDRVDQNLSDAAPQAFGSFMMFSEPINSAGLEQWNKAIDEGNRLFLAANAKNKTLFSINKKSNKKLNSYIQRINDANNELINLITTVYSTMYEPYAGQKSADISYADKVANANHKHKFEGKFVKIKNDMQALQKEIKKSKSAVSGKDIILSLATYIFNYADTAINSMQYHFDTKFKVDIDIAIEAAKIGKPARGPRPWKKLRDE